MDSDLKTFFGGKPATERQVAGDHYKRAIQPWDIISEWELNFWAGNALKYLLRYPHKGRKEDLEKARHYLDYLIENYEELHASE